MVARVIMLSACILCCWSDHCPSSPPPSPLLFLPSLSPFSFSPCPSLPPPSPLSSGLLPCVASLQHPAIWPHAHSSAIIIECSHHSIVLPPPEGTTLISTLLQRVMSAASPCLSVSIEHTLHHATQIASKPTDR